MVILVALRAIVRSHIAGHVVLTIRLVAVPNADNPIRNERPAVPAGIGPGPDYRIRRHTDAPANFPDALPSTHESAPGVAGASGPS